MTTQTVVFQKVQRRILIIQSNNLVEVMHSFSVLLTDERDADVAFTTGNGPGSA